MESANIDSMCRCCAAEGMFKDIKTSYHWMGEEEVYGDMLRECFDVKLSSVEEGGICEVCITQLRNAANFKKQVLHTEKKFKRHLETRRFKPTEVKEEVSADNDNSSDDDRGADSEDDEDYVPEFEIPIKTETPEESKSRKRSAKATTSRAKKSRVDDDKSIVISDVKPIKVEIEWDVEKNMEVKASIKKERLSSKASRKREKGITPKQTKNKKVDTVKVEKLQPLRIKPAGKVELLDVDKHRYNVRAILQYSNATPIRAHYAGNGYACCFCKQYFHKAADLKSHTLQTHDDQTKRKYMQKAFLFKLFVKLDITFLRCGICSVEMINLDELIEHLNTVHDKGIHTDVKNQIMCFKLEDDGFRCFICSVEYHSFKNLLEHAHSHYRNFVCDICDAGFINRLKLYGHVYNKHKGAGSHKCNTCEKVFDTPIKLKTHERIHSGSVLYKCHECGEKFPKKKEKRDHMINAHGAEFAQIKCTACEKMFISKASLSVHINRDHLMDRRHQCEVCEKTFFTSSFLRDHMVSHSRIREIQCDECPKTFARKKALREHMKSHTGDRRFKCTYCDMAFLQKCSLKGHLRSRHDAELQ